MTATYWQIGQRLVESEQEGEARAAYGSAKSNVLLSAYKHFPFSHILLANIFAPSKTRIEASKVFK